MVSALIGSLSSVQMQPQHFLFFSTRGGAVSEEEIHRVQDKAQKDLMLVRQGLDEALTRERRAMHCGLVKKRRDLISGTVSWVLLGDVHCASKSFINQKQHRFIKVITRSLTFFKNGVKYLLV